MAMVVLGFAAMGARASETERERVRSGTRGGLFSARLTVMRPCPNVCMPRGGHGMWPVSHYCCLIGRFKTD